MLAYVGLQVNRVIPDLVTPRSSEMACYEELVWL